MTAIPQPRTPEAVWRAAAAELVEAVVAKRAEARAMTTPRRGLPETAPAPTRYRIAAGARARRPLAALVEVGGVVRAIRPLATRRRRSGP